MSRAEFLRRCSSLCSDPPSALQKSIDRFLSLEWLFLPSVFSLVADLSLVVKPRVQLKVEARINGRIGLELTVSRLCGFVIDELSRLTVSFRFFDVQVQLQKFEFQFLCIRMQVQIE